MKPLSYPQRVRQGIADFRAVFGTLAKRVPGVIAIMLASTALDLLGVALVAPFLATLFSLGAKMPAWIPFGSDLSYGLGLQILALTLLAVFALKGVAAYWAQRKITRFTEFERARIMGRLLRAFQAMPYELHSARNSAEFVNKVLWYSHGCTAGVLSPLMRMAADLSVFVVLGAFLAWTDWRAVSLLLALLAAVFLVVGNFVRPRLTTQEKLSAGHNAGLIEATSQALAGLREVRLLGREAYFHARLLERAAGLAESTSRASALQLIPRHAVEVAIVGFLIVLVWVTRTGGESAQALVPVLGTFAAAAMRLMPASTAILSSWNSLRSNAFALHEVARDLALPQEKVELLRTPWMPAVAAEVFRELRLENVHFSYAGATVPAIRDVSLTVKAGDVVALTGRSGSGKSTLADVIMGMLAPQSGTVSVNGWDIAGDMKRWHEMIAFVPQTVYLIDDTLRRNVALGEPDAQIDESSVLRAVAEAQLDTLVAELGQGLDTVVGERGARLSGGQRQRVAIARALYHNRQFIVLDEATSALDAETEEAVVQTMRALRGRKTLVVIAHKPSLTEDATTFVRLDESEHGEGVDASLMVGTAKARGHATG